MDPFIRHQYHNTPIEDPCNPPYWYPRYIPEYCLEKTERKPKLHPPPAVPIPVPHPVALPAIYPISNSLPMNYPPSQILPNVPVPIARSLPIGGPYSILPVMGFPGESYQLFRSHQQIGMVPGLPGIVSPDGGVNILPFSDAYSDLLEKHERRVLKERMQKVLRDHKRFSWRKHY